MKAQYSLRTLIVVMILGGPLLAAAAKVAPTVVRYFWPYEVAQQVTWAEALAEAQKVQPLGGGFLSVEKRGCGATRVRENQSPEP